MSMNYRTQQVGDVKVLYREAGAKKAPVLLLLHGFPSSSHKFRELIPLLADRSFAIKCDRWRVFGVSLFVP
jgi:pimeloyl-ACP methyl ester carboxylesterase